MPSPTPSKTLTMPTKADAPAPAVVVEDATPEPPPSESRESELATLVAALQARLDQLEGRQIENYPDDDKLFIAKHNGEKWSERRIDPQSRQYVEMEMNATAFYGPFTSEEAVAAYLDAKRSRREDSYIAWQGVRTVTGREKRQIQAAERAEREADTLPAEKAYFQRG